ncbi:MAG: hypothetical protein P4N59_33040 [Negativicutes bacterium]|nr:hypothetical protein [Negativicutes bacterium]
MSRVYLRPYVSTVMSRHDVTEPAQEVFEIRGEEGEGADGRPRAFQAGELFEEEEGEAEGDSEREGHDVFAESRIPLPELPELPLKDMKRRHVSISEGSGTVIESRGEAGVGRRGSQRAATTFSMNPALLTASMAVLTRAAGLGHGVSNSALRSPVLQHTSPQGEWLRGTCNIVFMRVCLFDSL